MTERKVLRTSKPRARLTLPAEPVKRTRAVLHVDVKPPVLQRVDALLAQRSPRARAILRMPLPQAAVVPTRAPVLAPPPLPPANLPLLVERGCFLKGGKLRDFGPGKWALAEDRKARTIKGRSADGMRCVVLQRTERADGAERVTAIYSNIPKNAILASYIEGKKEALYVHDKVNAWLYKHLMHEPKF